MFVTNNSTKSRKGYLGKFTGLGLNVNAEEIYSSSYAAAAYLASIGFPKDKKVRQPVGRPTLVCVSLHVSQDCMPLAHRGRAGGSVGDETHLVPWLTPWCLALQVYIVGEAGIQEELDLKGIAHCGGPADADKKIELKPGFALHHDEDVRRCSPPAVHAHGSLGAFLGAPTRPCP